MARRLVPAVTLVLTVALSSSGWAQTASHSPVKAPRSLYQTFDVSTYRLAEAVDQAILEEALYAAVQAREAEEAAEAEAAREAAQIAAQRVSRPVLTITGDCAAFLQYVPAYIIDRESRGNPNAVNPYSGALGCLQELPGHFAEVSPWNSNAHGTCYGLDPGTQAGQLACAGRLSNGGSNLAPWS